MNSKDIKTVEKRFEKRRHIEATKDRSISEDFLVNFSRIRTERVECRRLGRLFLSPR